MTTPDPTAILDDKAAALAALAEEEDGATDTVVPDPEDDDDAAAAVDPPAAAESVVDEPPADKAHGAMIPKARFDEAVAKERERAESRFAELQQQIEDLKKGPPIDYDEAITNLDAKWNGDEGEYDGTQAEYMAERDALLVGKTKADARAEFQQEQAQLDAQKRLGAWQKDAEAFVAGQELLKNEADFARFNRFLKDLFVEQPDATHAEWLEEAMSSVTARAIAEGRITPPATTPGGKPHAARDKADAVAQARASAVPAVANGGMGDRGRNAEIDVMKLKPGQWGKLTKEQQNALIGEDD